MGAPRPPMEYLAKCSQTSLESMELARLNQSANLRKEFLQVLHELIESEVDARLARTVLEWRRAQCEVEGLPSFSSIPVAAIESESPPTEETPRLIGCEQLAIAFQPDPAAACESGSREAKFETRRGKRTRRAQSSGNAAAAGKASDSGADLDGRRAASARASRALASPNAKELWRLEGRQSASTGHVEPKLSLASSGLSTKDSARRRCGGKFLPRQLSANHAAEVVAYGEALRDAS